MSLKVGDQLPKLSLPNQDGKQVSLSDYLGKYLLIYFYPKDFTPGCTKEACNFRDSFPRFKEDKFAVIGVSTDSVESHQKFAKKYDLPFTLLSDKDKTMVEAFGVWQKKKFLGKEYLGTVRTSFLISPKGEIAKIYPNVNPLTHVAQVEKDLQGLL